MKYVGVATWVRIWGAGMAALRLMLWRMDR